MLVRGRREKGVKEKVARAGFGVGFLPRERMGSWSSTPFAMMCMEGGPQSTHTRHTEWYILPCLLATAYIAMGGLLSYFPAP